MPPRLRARSQVGKLSQRQGVGERDPVTAPPGRTVTDVTFKGMNVFHPKVKGSGDPALSAG
jgi:hypothetical protein